MDFEKIISDMLKAMKGEIGEDWSKAKCYVKQILENNKEDIKEITEYYLNGELTEDEYIEELKDNMKTFENELLVLNIMKKKTIQDAVNAGIDVLIKAVKVI